MDKEKVIKTLAEYFKDIENAEAVYLFGSFAKIKIENIVILI